MTSRLILLISIGGMVVLAAADVAFHGHFSDRYQRGQVERALSRARYNTPEEQRIRATVDDRWVVLEGTVQTPQDRLRVPDAVLRQVRGVRGLTNNIRVAGCEEGVIATVRDYVSADPAEGEISYVVEPPCIVTLTGWVPTGRKKERITHLVASIPGVKEVRNRLEIRLQKKEIQERLITILRVQNIYFDFNSARIRPESLPAVDQIGALMKEQSHSRLRIEGHTDAVAGTEFNQDLSQARAQAVSDALVARGVSPQRLEVAAYGETKPVASNDTPEGRAENRRIEFKVL